MAKRVGLAVILLASIVVGVRGAPPALAAEPRDITAFACPADQVSSPFTDTGGNVHAFAIDCLYTYGVTSGTSPTTYSPGLDVTRGQLATLLFHVLASNGVDMDTSDQGFTDVAGNVHEEHINGIVSARVAHGTSPTTFEPDAPVSREQTATLLINAVVTIGAFVQIGDNAFDDDDGSVHEAAIDGLAFNGIATGVGERRFDPFGSVRRDSLASFLARLVDFGVEEGQVHSRFEESFRATALTPAQVATEQGGEPDAIGSGRVWTIGQPDVVCFRLLTRDIGSGVDQPERAAYLAAGERGEVGEILVELPPSSAGNFIPYEAATAAGTRCVKTDPTVVDRVIEEPEGIYLGLSTFEWDEALRGQLGVLAEVRNVGLVGAEEVPGPGDPDGGGEALVGTTTQPDHVCWFVLVRDVGTVTAAHIHAGAQGTAGPPVITFDPVPGSDGEVDWCIGDVDPEVIADVMTSPADHYLNVHTADFPDGAIRGQLG